MEASQIQPHHINDRMRSSGQRLTQCWIFTYLSPFYPEDNGERLGQITSLSVMTPATSLHPRSLPQITRFWETKVILFSSLWVPSTKFLHFISGLQSDTKFKANLGCGNSSYLRYRKGMNENFNLFIGPTLSTNQLFKQWLSTVRCKFLCS